MIEEGLSTRNIAKVTGVSQSYIRVWLKKYGLKTNPKEFRDELQYSEEDLRIAVAKSRNLSEVCDNLNIPPVGGYFYTVKSRIDRYGISTGHFTKKRRPKKLPDKPADKPTLWGRLKVAIRAFSG